MIYYNIINAPGLVAVNLRSCRGLHSSRQQLHQPLCGEAFSTFWSYFFCSVCMGTTGSVQTKRGQIPDLSRRELARFVKATRCEC